ncbi:MAG: phosphatidylglycerophosphatase A [Syntrophaceae bacterium]|nr:phosphatidylglycerophosphatase A [Syntrophaceae bacterium]
MRVWGEKGTNYFIVILASGFGVGYSPIAPGTMGTLLTIPIYYFLSTMPSLLYELTLLTFFFLSSWISGQAQRYWGKEDDRRIVVDEMMGFLITMLWVPRIPGLIIVGFLLFRFFDILKPFPIRRIEKRLRGGFGVVLDDVVAGIYGNIILQIIWYLILSPGGRGVG